MIEKERRTVEFMIKYYCRRKHKKVEICQDCSDLLKYIEGRLNKCMYEERKPVCKSCKTHCYSKLNREKIREVMRFTGPRMIFVNPPMALDHFLREMKKVNSKR